MEKDSNDVHFGMNQKDIINRLRYQQQKHGLSHADIASKIGWDRSKVQRVFFGKQSHHLNNLCLELSNSYNWSYDWMINGDVKGQENFEEQTQSIPLYQYHKVDHAFFNEDTLYVPKKLCYRIQNLCLHEMIGDSMQPTIYANEIVLADYCTKFIGDGIYLLKIWDVVQVKRIQQIGNEIYNITCDNPNYQNLALTEHEQSNLDIIAKVKHVVTEPK